MAFPQNVNLEIDHPMTLDSTLSIQSMFSCSYKDLLHTEIRKLEGQFPTVLCSAFHDSQDMEESIH